MVRKLWGHGYLTGARSTGRWIVRKAALAQPQGDVDKQDQHGHFHQRADDGGEGNR